MGFDIGHGVAVRIIQLARDRDVVGLHAALEAGADVDSMVNGRTPLSVAVEAHDESLVAWLLYRGADPGKVVITAAHGQITTYEYCQRMQDDVPGIPLLRMFDDANARRDVLDGLQAALEVGGHLKPDHH